ncbi:PP2C family protein-serine/threonine phosphatase [Sphingomonas sp. NCPPB 2930]
MNSDLPQSSTEDLLLASLLDEINSYKWDQFIQGGDVDLGFAFQSHLGLRRGRNEDRLAVAEVMSLNGDRYKLAIVCDGVGGSKDGDVAASLTIASVITELCRQKARTSLETILPRLLKAADRNVRTKLDGSGTTTLSVVLVSPNGQLAAANIGDSRIYAWNPGRDVEQISVDDTMENEFRSLPGNHDALINAKGLRGRLSQAIGEAGRLPEELRIKTFGRKSFPGGILLGSDGLWKNSGDFNKVVSNAASSSEVVRRSVALAIWTGGVDNVSVIAIENVDIFGSSLTAKNVNAGAVEIKLWIGQAMYKFFMPNLQGAGSRRQDKTSKTGVGKKKVPRSAEVAHQMPLTEDDDMRPTIQVSIDNNNS